MKRFLMLAIAAATAMTIGVGHVQDIQADGGQDAWGRYTSRAATPQVGPVGGPQVGNFGRGGPIVGPGPAGARYGFRGGFRGGNLGFGYWPAWNDFYNPYSFNRPETQPYFAMNPPVYYSDQIIPRPMGISPFPAPPGVLPVEMTLTPQSETVVNPFFNRKDQPVAGEPSTTQQDDTDT